MKNHRIGTRLAAGFGLLILFSLIMLVSGIYQLRHTAEATRQMMQEPLQKERLVTDWYAGISASVQRATAVARSNDNALTELFAAANAASSKEISERQAQFAKLISNPQEQALFDKVIEYRQAYIKARDAIIAAKTAGQLDQVQRLFEQTFLPASRDYLGGLQSLRDHQRASIDRVGAEIDGSAARGYALLGGIGLAIALTGALIAWSLTRSIVQPLTQAVQAARAVADGNLTLELRAEGRDEAAQLLHALRDMTQRLRGIVGDVLQGSQTIASAATQIAAGNRDLSSRTEEQAGSLQQTAASMEEITSTVRHNADNARQANQLARETATQAARSGQVADQVVETMGGIHDASRRIVDIIGVIDGIAFQTNILALNAAVEAARAGEQGRGFAVVASEVRNLAQRSAEAAKEIKGLIGDTVNKVDAGTQLVEQAGASIRDVVNSVQRVHDIVAEISAATQEQTAGLELVNQNMAQMDLVTQQNAALVEESTAATQSLEAQASQLARTVSVFRVGAAPSATVPPHGAWRRTSQPSLDRPRPEHDGGDIGIRPARHPQPLQSAATGLPAW
ncbi:methyl-accepting chemotaxis sensory transducer [Hylemonella gracilis ATCC 19624]|uniref:Methyl-accepting chemotaxis sensory transducer n=1 Tax=Hylemonella gracilis ATCC 19624 TaxID=887062 RepID=F3KRP2_9BURK|nr:methyl-accepting chemotaxis sensory transducer [Hylemonella gracilis ATCC 19624]